MELEFLDFSGLTLYDSLIKNYVNEGDAEIASDVDGLEERVQSAESGLAGLRKVTNTTRGAVENIQTTLDDGVVLAEQLVSGITSAYTPDAKLYKVDSFPTDGNKGSIVSSDGLYDSITSKGRYAQLTEGGSTTDSVINVSIPNYTELTEASAILFLKTTGVLQTAQNTSLSILGYRENEDGTQSNIFSATRKLYFNGKPANETNTWDANEVIMVWTDGSFYHSMPVRSYTNASKLPYNDTMSVKDKIESTDDTISALSTATKNITEALECEIRTLSSDTKDAIDDLSAKTNSAINSLSAATKNAITDLSGKTNSAIAALSASTKNELTRVEGKVDVNSAAITALSLGAKVTASVSPTCIYKGEATTVTAKATFTPTDLKPATIELRENNASGTLLASGTSVNTVSKAQSYTLTDNSKTFYAGAVYEGAKFMNTVALQARYSIYCGFCTTTNGTPNYSEIENTSHRLSARTSAAGTYAATATTSNQKYCILVPSDIGALSTFTMGGAPVDMASGTTTVGGVSYKTYSTNALYNAGGEINISAS